VLLLVDNCGVIIEEHAAAVVYGGAEALARGAGHLRKGGEGTDA
jgi:hypothetical protein